MCTSNSISDILLVERCNSTKNMITPFDDFVYLLNNVILGEEPSIEDFILLIGTIVAFVAFILWCCFPIVPKDSQTPLHYEAKDYQIKYNQRKLEYNPS